tara:strand:- start:711 stop:893 length:183 start_codon:yes stop_codon:yes gene_type:complete
MIVQKMLIEAVIKAIGKKTNKKASALEEKIERLFKINKNLTDRIQKLEEQALKATNWYNQ